MPDTQYSYSVDLENLATSHSQAVLLVPPGSTVLDIGAADGSVARPLAARGCRVWAIERDAAAASKARSACERVIVGDVEALDLEEVLEGRKFDFVLLLDVLEHLRDPLATLVRAREQLVPGGRAIVSIPNIAHGAVRLSLMSGNFTYTETGLLDRTHLRFFDRRSAEALLADAQLRIVERLRVTRGLNETEIPVDLSEVPPALIQKLESDPDANTYQFVLVGVRSEGEYIPDGASLAERLQRRTEELEAQYRQVEVYARSLEQQNRERAEAINQLTTERENERSQLAEVRSELQARMGELAQRHLELRHLQADLAVKEAFIAELREQLKTSQHDLAVTQDALQRLQVFVGSAGLRIAAKAARVLSRYPRTYRVFQRVARRLVGP